MAEEDSSVSRLVKAKFFHLNNLLLSRTDKITFALFVSPDEWTEEYKARWLKKFHGDKAKLDKTLKEWAKPKEGGEVYKYLKDFKLNATDLPCLVLFTNLYSREVAVCPIPKHSDDDALWDYFKSIADALYSCIEKQPSDDKARLGCIKHNLTSYWAKLRSAAHGSWEFVKENPVWVIETIADINKSFGGLAKIGGT